MGCPEFIKELRTHIGHAPLWLSGITAVVQHQGQVLAVRVGQAPDLSLITGIIDPGEHPADAAAREVLEEAGVTCRPIRLASVDVSAPVTHPGGDQAQYLNYTFYCEYLSGTAQPDHDETTHAAWYPVADLSSGKLLRPDHHDRLESALAPESTTRFFFDGKAYRP